MYGKPTAHQPGGRRQARRLARGRVHQGAGLRASRPNNMMMMMMMMMMNIIIIVITIIIFVN